MTADVRRGDIFYVTGRQGEGSEQGGDRPAVIVSNDIGNKFAPVVELVYLTTQKKKGLPTHVPINSAQRPSTALCEQIVTVCKSRLHRLMGHVTQEEMKHIDAALTKSLGIQKGAHTMQVIIKTPFGDMNFDMKQEDAAELVQKAFQYAAGKTPGKAQPPEIPAEAPPVAQDARKEVRPINKPTSRVEHLFGDFRSALHTAQQPRQTPAYSEEDEGYKGFLLVECKRCGKIKGFCAKRPIAQNRCECGEVTELHDLKVAHVKCANCGRSYTYKTNIDRETFEYNCLNCGSPVDLTLNKRGDTYVTVAD